MGQEDTVRAAQQFLPVYSHRQISYHREESLEGERHGMQETESAHGQGEEEGAGLDQGRSTLEPARWYAGYPEFWNPMPPPLGTRSACGNAKSPQEEVERGPRQES